jgi:hypothetical protein
MTIWFYGDSWPAGWELDNKDLNRLEMAFPAIVGHHLDCEIVNKAVGGSSQPYLIEAFLDSEPQAGDLMIFCLTAKTRRMYRTPKNEIVQQQFNHDECYVNQYEDERVSAQTCALLYFLCKEKNVTPYFFNLFDTVRHGDRLEKEIPDHHWLIPKNHSVLSWIFDPEFFTRFKDHHHGDFSEWLDRDCELVQKYIRPCKYHPNQTGHQAIADFIVGALIVKGHFDKYQK